MTKILERETTGSTLERPVEIERPPVEIPPRPELPAPRRPYVRWLGWMLVVAVIALAGILGSIQGGEVVLDDGSFEANELARMLALAPEIDATAGANGFEARVAAADFAAISLVPNIEKMSSFEASFPELAEALERGLFVSMLKANIEKTFSYEASFPTIDTSFESNELARMLTLAPTIDTSFEANELARMLTLAPTIDTSFEANELARMLALAPEVTDGSFEANESARLSALAPDVSDGSFEANELARMLRLAPETDTSFETNELARMLELEPEG